MTPNEAPSLYTSPTLANHWIVNAPDGWYLFPATHGGWNQRRPYNAMTAYRKHLVQVSPETARFVLADAGYDG